MNRPKRHHVTPESYLNTFASLAPAQKSPRLSVLIRRTGVIEHRVKTKDIFYRHFYDHLGPDGRLHGSAEKPLNTEVEEPGNRVIASLLDGKAITYPQTRHLARYLMVSIVRSLWFHICLRAVLVEHSKRHGYDAEVVPELTQRKQVELLRALEMARKEQDIIRRYREAVVWAWVDEDLNGREVKRLRDLVSRLELGSHTAADIEREVIGETKEEILERREQASAEHYRTAVEEASTDNELSNAEGVWLRNLASELGLSSDTAADIEREVTGDTIPAILQRQRHLGELYVQARQLHQDQEWQSVVDVFERIHSEAPAFPDPEGLLESAREALDKMRKVAGLYDQALRYVDGSEWQQALESFEEVQRLEPGFRETEELLSRVRRELAPPPKAVVPDLSGQAVSLAEYHLDSEGLRLGNKHEAPSDTVPEGQIIEQSPEAGREVQTDTSVSITISSGPSTEEVPDLVGKGRDEEGSIEVRQAVSLSLGNQAFFDELTRVCAKYSGLGYYVNEAIPGQKLADARSSISIPPDERVIALVDNSSILSRGIGLAVCGDGIRWRNYADRPVSKKVRGFLEWSEFADVPLREYQWAADYGIEMGRDNMFVAWKDNTMDQHRLVKLLQDIQSLVKTSISY